MIKKVIFIILTLNMLLSIFCTTYAAEVTVTSISLNSGKTLNLSVDDFATLDVTLKPSNANSEGITFTSSKPTVASVDYKGNVTAKRVGNTTIAAELNGKISSITVKVTEKNKLLDVDFTVKSAGKNFEEITVTPHRYDDDDELIEDEIDDEYYIYLPSGYFIEGKSASYVADKNGVYPFTIYYGNMKRTFYYTVKDIDSTDSDDDDYEDDRDDINLDYKLMYDYEKKQVLFNIDLDETRTVITPDNKTTVSNNVNYYISTLKNNTPFDFSIIIDNFIYDYKVIKQGEFYLLIALSPVDYDNYSTFVNYLGYNFTTNENFKAVPNKGLIYDNGNYEVLIQSTTNTKEIFNFNISDIDFKRPFVKTSFQDDYTLELEIEDDFGLDYMITFDGKYVALNQNTATITYKHSTKIDYDGEYIFTVVDKAGNRTISTTDIESRKTPRKHSIDYDVHNYKYTKDLFTNIGILYDNNENDLSIYENTLPSYMNGSNPLYFKPDLPISRAEIVTLFCRITDLPYDTNAFLKTKFTDIEYHWARDYISMGSSKKYVTGYKDKTFKPDSSVTRAEFCKMLTNISAFKTMVSVLPATSNYNFVDINAHWAQKEIIKIVSRDIVTGINNYFYPDKPITRAEVVHAINTIYGLNPTYSEIKYIDSLYNKYYNFKDIKGHKYYNDILISLVGMYKEKIN